MRQIFSQKLNHEQQKLKESTKNIQGSKSFQIETHISIHLTNYKK